MLDAFRLELRYDPAERTADCRIVLSDDAIPTIHGSLTALTPVVPIEHARSGGHAHGPTARRRSGSTFALAVAPSAGLEPATCGLEVRCSVQLSYEGVRSQGTRLPARVRLFGEAIDDLASGELAEDLRVDEHLH